MSMDWRTHFHTLGDHVAHLARDGEDFTLNLQAERSDFVRFNHGKVRQPGSVDQASVAVRWILGRRHASAEVTLTGHLGEDRARVEGLIAELRDVVPMVPEDPHLLLPDAVVSTDDADGVSDEDGVHAAAAIVEAAQAGATPLDLVGIYAGGTMQRGFRNRAGQQNWFSRHRVVVDWSVVHGTDKAVKCTWAGPTWSEAGFADVLEDARRDLAALGRPVRTLTPGAWRAYLTPAALAELMELTSHDGFSARARATKQSCLQRLVAGEARFDPSVHLVEDTEALGAVPFSSMGFVRPARLPLVVDGADAGALVSPRSGQAYGLAHNGADDAEAPQALSMRGGTLSVDDARAALGTGVWVSNLWYANHSDRNAARMTGMTRFATMWVEDGEVVAPVSVMRFDDSLYDVLGARLEALTDTPAWLPDASSYGWRSTNSQRLPGALVSGLTFTL